MVNRFRFAISLEMGESAIGGAVGMAHDEDAFRLMQADRHPYLLEDKVLLEVIARGGQCFRASGDDDHVGVVDCLLLKKFSDGLTNAVVKAAENRGFGNVGRVGRVEMEYFSHGLPYCKLLTRTRDCRMVRRVMSYTNSIV